MRGRLAKRILNHLKNPLGAKLPNQAKPSIPKKSFMQKHGGKIKAGGLVGGGAIADSAIGRVFEKKKKDKKDGNVTVIVQKKYLTQNIRR